MKITVLVPLLLLLTACASNVPREIQRDITERDLSVNMVRVNTEQYQGEDVRWGGTIVNVENKANESWIEIVGKPLNSYGRPVDSDRSMGRFLVRVDGFVDPSIYSEGREMTVFGTIESKVSRQIDEHPYTYPLIKAKTYYLWSDQYARRHYYRHHYYPYGFYPYGFYPYSHRFHYGFGHGFHRRFHHFGFGFRHHHW